MGTAGQVGIGDRRKHKSPRFAKGGACIGQYNVAAKEEARGVD